MKKLTLESKNFIAETQVTEDPNKNSLSRSLVSRQ